MQTLPSHKETQNDTVAIQQVPVRPEYKVVTGTEYALYGFLLISAAAIIAWFLREDRKTLITSNTQSNIDLKNSIEKLASVAQEIHDDLSTYKLEVEERFATKEALRELKEDIGKACILRHSRRSTDKQEEQ